MAVLLLFYCYISFRCGQPYQTLPNWAKLSRRWVASGVELRTKHLCYLKGGIRKLPNWVFGNVELFIFMSFWNLTSFLHNFSVLVRIVSPLHRTLIFWSLIQILLCTWLLSLIKPTLSIHFISRLIQFFTLVHHMTHTLIHTSCHRAKAKEHPALASSIGQYYLLLEYN